MVGSILRNGTEQNGTERNGTERNRTEQNGTERNGTEWNGMEQNDGLNCGTPSQIEACRLPLLLHNLYF